jgi:hypothetical protein
LQCNVEPVSGKFPELNPLLHSLNICYVAHRESDFDSAIYGLGGDQKGGACGMLCTIKPAFTWSSQENFRTALRDITKGSRKDYIKHDNCKI